MNTRPLIIWTNATRLQAITPAIQRAQRTISHLGGPDLPPRAAAELTANPIDDLSMLLRAASDSDILLAARPPEETLEYLESRGTYTELKKRGNQTVSLEPLPSRAMSPAIQDAADLPALPTLAPLLRRAPLVAALRDALTNFGTIQTALIAARDRSTLGGLGARLLDALDLLSELMGEPESIDAAIASPRAVSGVRAAPPDDLTLLTGSLTAHLRFETGASAVLSLTDQAGNWFRGLTISGEGGLIRFDDHGFEWTDPQGKVIDHTKAPEGSASERLADHIISEAFTADPAPPSIRLRSLTAAGAAVLSSRTGQPESPATIKRMASLPA